MPFKKGHEGYEKPKKYKRRKATGVKNKKNNRGGGSTLDTYFITHNRFSKLEKGEKYLDQAKIDYYINNDLDITELLDD